MVSANGLKNVGKWGFIFPNHNPAKTPFSRRNLKQKANCDNKLQTNTCTQVGDFVLRKI